MPESVKRFLITTADERSWRTDCPVLFLGEWCRLYDRREVWQQLDARIVPYHWDDREQLYRDYLYLREQYEILLGDLSEALNRFHGVQHSLRYWRILVGPWLGYFIQMLFDRWTMIQRAICDYEINGTVLLDLPTGKVIPNGKADFEKHCFRDLWNHHIYGRILDGWTTVPYKRITLNESDFTPALKTTLARSLKQLVRRVSVNGLNALSGALSRRTDMFVITSCLSLKEDFRLQLAIGQFPLRWESPPLPEIAADLQLRKQFRMNATDHTGFDSCVRSLISEQIPTLYLEGYKTLQRIVEQLPWPRCPQAIFTSNSFSNDDVFKAWAAARVEAGVSLVIGQHGGHYGTGRWSYNEEHELAIADRYLTWGWTNGSPKHYPVGMLNVTARVPGVWNPRGGILLVTTVHPRYSYWLFSIMVAGQTAHYLSDQFRFVAALPLELREQLLIRLFAADYGWSQAARWQDRYPSVRLDPGTSPMEPLIRQSRIYVATYNATTFLESLGRNIPTIMFWNTKHSELRPSAKPYFEKLRQVGIFHGSPESAAAKIDEIWDNVESWWNQREIQEARLYFCNSFARVSECQVQALKEALTTVRSGRKA